MKRLGPTPRQSKKRKRRKVEGPERQLFDLFTGHGPRVGYGGLPNEEAHWPWEKERLAEGRKAAAEHNARLARA